MATTAPNTVLLSVPAAPAATSALSQYRRRRLDRQSGQALEILGHAIDYLADEFALDCINRSQFRASGPDPSIAAIELLKRLNREIYLSCPPIPTVAERLRSLFNLKPA